MTEPTEQDMKAAMDEIAAEHDRAFPDAGIADWYARWKTMPLEEQVAEVEEYGPKILSEMREMHGLDENGDST